MLAGGAIVSDCDVENSVIGVRTVMREATVRNSLIMGADMITPGDDDDEPPIGIGQGSVIENAIIDKNVRIGKNVRIVNEAGVKEAEGEDYVIREGLVVIPKGTVLPDDTVI
jgi:glucose-1-phosphate adenylyltransferase